ncbi:hypothetical protein ZHAS_00006714 [Anopheles sinensis]|uniref:Uncharacterized protein n=1 Tax=Anopheles sinensis TaxID=74873 RepID=A0A084VM12_ANOSI|nr:hypothetical protein ZHAS_00006714 [Anopheles sinensis]
MTVSQGVPLILQSIASIVPDVPTMFAVPISQCLQLVFHFLVCAEGALIVSRERNHCPPSPTSITFASEMESRATGKRTRTRLDFEDSMFWREAHDMRRGEGPTRTQKPRRSPEAPNPRSHP